MIDVPDVTLALVVQHGEVPAARATVRSAFRIHGPRVRVCVTALCHCYRPVGGETVVTTAELGVRDDDVTRRAAALDPAQLSTWLLARLVRHALSEGTPLVSLRPGTHVLADLADVAGALGAEHRWGAQVRSGRLASWAADRDGPRGGRGEPGPVHDPDLVVLTADALTVADEWCRLTARGVGHAQAVDVLSGLFAHRSFRGTEVILGPDTMAGTPAVDVESGSVRVDGRRASLLDLSRADPSTPWLMDVVESRPGIALSEHPHLAEIVADLLRERAADTAPGDLDHPGPFATTSVGAPYDGVLRSLVAAAGRQELDEAGPRPPDPFDVTQAGALRAWLAAPVPAGDPFGVPRYLDGVRAARPDLRAAFPAVPGRDASRLVAWAARHGSGEGGADPALLAEVMATVDADRAGPGAAPTVTRASRASGPGVNLVGYLTGELGIGESARLVRSALESAHVALSVRPVTTDLASLSRGQGPEPHARPAGATTTRNFDTTLLCVNAAQMPSVTAETGDAWAGTRRIGYWYWEVEEFPESQHVGFRYVDEVWVATEFVRRAVAPHAPVPVVTMTPPLFRPTGAVTTDPTAALRRLGLPPGRPVILFIFDYLSTAERKNPWGALSAYQRAFPLGRSGDSRPLLVLKSTNAHRRPRDAERLRLLAAGDPDVVLLEEHLPADQLKALVAGCDAYLSLHRSEGLGLTIADAMSAGRPVVATGYGGNMEFMADDTAYVVPWTPVPIPPGCDPYPVGSPWADPDLDAAADALQRIMADPLAAAEVGRRAADVLRQRHGPGSAGARMREYLDETRWPASRRWRREARADVRRVARRLRTEALDRLS